MPPPVPPFTLKVRDGGKFIAGGTAGAVSAIDYTEKTNFRRFDDAEVRREGTLLFRPNLILPQGTQHFNTGTDVVGLWEAVRPNGDRAVVLLTPTDVYRFTYATGLWTHIGGPYQSSREWLVESIDGNLIFNNKIDLPFGYRVEDSATVPFYEMRDIGIVSAATMAVFSGFLHFGDLTEIASTSLNTWMNGPTPYGIVPANITNRIRYKIQWSDSKQPRNFAPYIQGAQILPGNHFQVILPYPMPWAFPVGSKLAVEGAGPNGGVLGGQVGIDEGVVVTAVNGNILTLSVAADAALTYPRTVQVLRFADVTTFVGSSTIQDDSSAILLLKPLKRGLIVYRETGIWVGRFTAVVETPFVFTPEWYGRITPTIPRACANVNGDYHLFPCKGRFYKFDGAGNPSIHEPMDNAREKFFNGLNPTNEYLCWSTNNTVTKESWFFCPTGVLCYDLVSDTASWLDETYTAAAYIRKPGSEDFWFILARAGQVLQYGATEDGPITFHRLGMHVPAHITFGITALGDDVNEKIVKSYMPLLATDSNDIALEVTISGCDSYAEPMEELISFPLDTPASLPLIELHYQNIYFQDDIMIVDTRDLPLSLVGRSFILGRIRSMGATRNYHGNP